MSQQSPGDEKGGKASNSKRPAPAVETVEETLTAAAEIVRAHNEAAIKNATMPKAKLLAAESQLPNRIEENKTQSYEAHANFHLFPITNKLLDQWNVNIASTCEQLQRIATAKNIEEALTLYSSFTAQNIERLYRQSLEIIALNPKNFLDTALKTLQPRL
ncbi:MAG: hypothetical protein EBS82_00935 [Methylocystaceae bacterium]|jgi:hypothetical protein|nr:hypothetical protein [Methylocystaceae bacterium]NBT96759.1 hypothetical protein [Methylocystaceae bacterium]